MNRRADYDKIDWSRSFAEVAKQLGVSRAAVQQAAKLRGIKSVAGRGGRRPGAGRKKPSH